ncbi:MAG: PEP-CTERM system histidine kinase PrsK, partial [Rhodanobacter sp.]
MIVIASYLTAAIAFLVGTVLLAISSRGHRTGTLLILAMAATVGWGAFLAYAEWQPSAAVNSILLAEVLRYGGWLVFLSALFSALPMSGLLRGLRIVAHVLWVLLAIY